MVETLHLGSVGLAAAGACCAAAAGGRDKALGILTALLMLTAMIDMTLHPIGIPAVGWAMILMLAAIVSGFLSTRHHRSAEPRQALRSTHLTLHRNIGLILMAGLVVAMNGHTEGVTDSHAAHGGLNLLQLVLGGGSVLYLALSIWIALRRVETRAPHRLESALMGLSILTMGAVAMI